MDVRDVCSWIAMFGSVCGMSAMAAPVEATAPPDDVFAAMRVQRVDPPVSIARQVLRGADGSSIRMADLKGKAVVVWTFLTH